MKFDPVTGSLFTDEGDYLKTLSCPLPERWEEMREMGSCCRMCDSCHRAVHDTGEMTDQELQELLRRDSGTCLKVSLAQRNCAVQSSRFFIRKHPEGPGPFYITASGDP